MLLPSGNPFKHHEEVLSMRPMILHTKRFDMFPPWLWGMLRRSRCVQISLLNACLTIPPWLHSEGGLHIFRLNWLNSLIISWCQKSSPWSQGRKNTIRKERTYDLLYSPYKDKAEIVQKILGKKRHLQINKRKKETEVKEDAADSC